MSHNSEALRFILDEHPEAFLAFGDVYLHVVRFLEFCTTGKTTVVYDVSYSTQLKRLRDTKTRDEINALFVAFLLTE